MSRTSVARWIRTLRHLRADQAAAQLRHFAGGKVTPVRLNPPVTWGASPVPVPFLGAPAHIEGDGSRLRLLRCEVDFGDRIDWDRAAEGPLWAFHLHQFDWLRQPGLDPGRRAAWMLDWVERHPRGVGWRPHPISLRLLSWIKLLGTPGALELDGESRERLVASMGDQAETLARHPEVRLQANHLFSNWLGVVAAGLAFRGTAADAWLACAGQLRTQMDRQIGASGSHVERSPMYHSLLLENVLDLLNLSRAAPGRAPRELDAHLEETAARMRGALAVWTHPDGQIALLSDSAFAIAQAPARLHAYAEALGVREEPPQRGGWLSDSGSLRLEAGSFSVLASLAGPQPAYQPGHAHCDALSFELCVGDERVVTDAGVAEYVPGDLRDHSRATRSHATIEVDGFDQAELWGAHRVGGRPTVTVEAVVPPSHAAARCAGWATRDTVHRREFAVTEAGVEIVDSIEGTPAPVFLSLPLAPGLEPEWIRSEDIAVAARVTLASGRILRIDLPEGADWALEREGYSPEFGLEIERACLRGRARNFRRGTWRFTFEP
ncbi:MAG: heparinase II/III family protein [Myxococcota bacterium]|nr:heparinase II/III family protein [Myxococcota bacterium]